MAKIKRELVQRYSCCIHPKSNFRPVPRSPILFLVHTQTKRSQNQISKTPNSHGTQSQVKVCIPTSSSFSPFPSAHPLSPHTCLSSSSSSSLCCLVSFWGPLSENRKGCTYLDQNNQLAVIIIINHRHHRHHYHPRPTPPAACFSATHPNKNPCSSLWSSYPSRTAVFFSAGRSRTLRVSVSSSSSRSLCGGGGGGCSSGC